MTTLKAHFDGKVLVPDEAVDLPVNCPLEVQVRPIEAGTQGGKLSSQANTALKDLAALAKRLPSDPNAPSDGSQQHDHYIYGTSKR